MVTRLRDVHSEKKLFVFSQGALGDVISSFPALSLLKDEFSRVELGCREGAGGLACLLGTADRSFDIDSAMFSSMFVPSEAVPNSRLLNFLASYDALLFFSFSEELATNVERWTGKPVFRIPPRPEPLERARVQKRLLEKLEDFGLVEQGAGENMGRLFRDYRGAGFDEITVFIQPGSGSPAKNWPLEKFFELESQLVERGYRPVFLLGPAERGLEERLLGRDSGHLKDDCKEKFDFGSGNERWGFREYEVVRPADLTQLANRLKTGGGYVGNDSGVTHLAAWLGLPTVAIFGPTDPARWKPAGRRVRVVVSDFQCEPCFEIGNRNCANPDCLERISPSEVCNAFESLMRN